MSAYDELPEKPRRRVGKGGRLGRWWGKMSIKLRTVRAFLTVQANRLDHRVEHVWKSLRRALQVGWSRAGLAAFLRKEWGEEEEEVGGAQEGVQTQGKGVHHEEVHTFKHTQSDFQPNPSTDARVVSGRLGGEEEKGWVGHSTRSDAAIVKRSSPVD